MQLKNLTVMQLALLPATLPRQELCACFQVGKRLDPRVRRRRGVYHKYDRRAVAFLIEPVAVGIFIVPLVALSGRS